MILLLINTNTIKPLIFPIGLEYIAGYLKVHGIDVRVFDSNFSNNLIDYIKSINPDFIGISIRNSDDCTFPSAISFLPEYKKLLNNIKSVTQNPVILGGAGFSVMPEEIIRYLDADYGIIGDAEEAVLKFIRFYPDLEGVPNLIYKYNGKYSTTSRTYFNMDFPVSTRGIFDNYRYLSLGGMGSIETKRGCNKKCIYCADLLSKGTSLRLRTPQQVVSEFNELTRLGVTVFHLCDSEFNIPYDHAVKVCHEIIKEGIHQKIRWYCYCSPTPFTRELARIMKAAGCAGINFGVDSIDNKILHNLGRDYTTDTVFTIGELCKTAKIPFMFDLLLGGPQEDEHTLKETIENAKKIDPDIVGTAVGLRVYNGTLLSKLITSADKAKNTKSLYGEKENNKNFLWPVFFISSEIGLEIFPLLKELTANDRRFLFSSGEKNYNYNSNQVLVDAISKGARGAYWHILSQE